MLQLYVFKAMEDWDDERMPASACRVGDYLARRPAWEPDLDDTLLLAPAAGASLLPINPFGPLGPLAAQLTEAADRLAAGERALIRSAIESTPIYLALEPRDDAMYLSMLGRLPHDMEHWPLPPGPFSGPADRRDELYAWVDAHRDELRPTGPREGWMPRDPGRLQDIRLAAPSLIADLRAESRAGMDLFYALRPSTRRS